MNPPSPTPASLPDAPRPAEPHPWRPTPQKDSFITSQRTCYQPWAPAYLITFITICGNKPDIGPNLKWKVLSPWQGFCWSCLRSKDLLWFKFIFVEDEHHAMHCMRTHCNSMYLFLFVACIQACTNTMTVLHLLGSPLYVLAFCVWEIHSQLSASSGSWGGNVTCQGTMIRMRWQNYWAKFRKIHLWWVGARRMKICTAWQMDSLMIDYVVLRLVAGFRQTSYPAVEAVMRTISLRPSDDMNEGSAATISGSNHLSTNIVTSVPMGAWRRFGATETDSNGKVAGIDLCVAHAGRVW